MRSHSILQKNAISYQSVPYAHQRPMTFRGIRRKTGTERAPNGQFTGIDMNAVTAKKVATTLALMTPKSIAALRRSETARDPAPRGEGDRKSTRLNSSN